MGYVTTQFHNLKARFVFDIRSLSVSIWKSPRQWLKFNFYNWLHMQIGAVEIMWHRLPSRRPTQRAPDVCPVCEGKKVFAPLFSNDEVCEACNGTGQRG
jgi:hypothetical protein